MRNIIKSFVITILAAISVAVLWQNPIICSLILICFTVLHFLLNSSKPIFRAFIAVSILGPLVEIIAIHFGAWTYANPIFLGIPLYLPLAWGNMGLFTISLIDSLRNSSK